MTELKCEEKHTPCPTGYLEWHKWAEEKAKTHKQIKCPDCNTYSIWVVKINAGQSNIK